MEIAQWNSQDEIITLRWSWLLTAFVNTSDTCTSIQSKANIASCNESIAFFEVFKFTSAIWMLLHCSLIPKNGFFGRLQKSGDKNCQKTHKLMSEFDFFLHILAI